MKKILLVLCCCSLFACAPYAPQPHAMKAGMVDSFHSEATIRLVNGQSKDDFRIKRMGGIPVNLKETTASTIAFLRTELAKNGIGFDPDTDKALKLSVDELYQLFYIPGVDVCQVTCSLETSAGLQKQYQQKDVSGLDVFHACNFAITKVVAEIINDPEVRDFIDPKLAR